MVSPPDPSQVPPHPVLEATPLMVTVIVPVWGAYVPAGAGGGTCAQLTLPLEILMEPEPALAALDCSDPLTVTVPLPAAAVTLCSVPLTLTDP